MKLELLKPAKSLNKAYLKQSIKQEQIETFKSELKTRRRHKRSRSVMPVMHHETLDLFEIDPAQPGRRRIFAPSPPSFSSIFS